MKARIKLVFVCQQGDVVFGKCECISLPPDVMRFAMCVENEFLEIQCSKLFFAAEIQNGGIVFAIQVQSDEIVLSYRVIK